MKILIEGEDYSIDQLNSVFDDPKFYNQNGNIGKITSVGYYHSFEKKELVYMLPKVFMKDNQETVFGIFKDELFNIEKLTIKNNDDLKWIRQLLVYFYNSLNEFKRRFKNSTLIESSLSLELNTNLGDLEYSYLDLLLSFVNFYKKNKSTILYKHIEYKSNQVKKPKWEKTIRKSVPLLSANNTPIYTEINNKKKVVNSEEELLTYFFSILNHFNNEHQLYLKIDPTYSLIKGEKFKKLQRNGLKKIKKIKHLYFSDTLKKMYLLCEIYFSKTDTTSSKKKKEEFISVKNYNLVFEDMIDKLFSDKLDEKKEVDSVSLDELKYNDDGKIIDHIYDYKSLIDTSNIFYIGDSKYYKSGSEAGKLSKFKQFTYAKNVIQFNIDLLNKNDFYKENIRYRDEVTEGYNITPNFFIYGFIENVSDFESLNLISKNDKPIKSFHFEDRLFDRDTLFVNQYKINFLFVLKAYTNLNNFEILKFRVNIKEKFRIEFLDFFNNKTKSGFEFYESNLNPNDYRNFVENNFKKLNGKCFCTIDNRLILAKFKNDNSLNDLLKKFNLIITLV